MNTTSKTSKFAVLLVIATACLSVSAREKYETIDATAYGTSTQLGRNVGVTLIIYEWSTPEDRQVLLDAFQKGQNQGLVNALQKMKAVGRIQIPGTLGYDELDLNDQDKSKSGGVLYPACQFTINKDGELQIELNQNAWRLSNIIDWKGTAEN